MEADSIFLISLLGNSKDVVEVKRRMAKLHGQTNVIEDQLKLEEI